jgi:hypothetical protein
MLQAHQGSLIDSAVADLIVPTFFAYTGLSVYLASMVVLQVS